MSVLNYPDYLRFLFTVFVKWQPTPAFLPGEFHGQRSLVGYSPRGLEESDTIEQLTLSLSLFTPMVVYFHFQKLTTVALLKRIVRLTLPPCTRELEMHGNSILGPDCIQWQVGLNSHSRAPCGIGQRPPSVGWCLSTFPISPPSQCCFPDSYQFLL